MRTAALVAVALGAVLAPASADAAATLSLERTPSAPKVVLTAAPGDTDTVSVLRLGDGPIAVSDGAGIVVDPASGCLASDDAISALCPSPGPNATAVVRLGDGDDRATVVGMPALLDGGPGDDVLNGGGYGDLLRGGAGDDVLMGNGGDDRLAGDGEPLTASGSTETTEIGDDVLSGGPGRDSVSYRGRRAGVTVDLTRNTPAGQAGEDDRISGVEDVAGGEGDDTLIGDAGGNRLEGNGGADTLTGASGDDELIGGPGANTLDGGPGDDLLDASGAQLDGGVCGPGVDTVAAPVAGPTVLGADCERVLSGGDETTALLLDARPSARTPKLLLLDAACPSTATRACATTLTVRAGPTTLATGSVRLRRGAAGQARLRITATGAALLASSQQPLTLRFTAPGFGWTATWSAPRPRR